MTKTEGVYQKKLKIKAKQLRWLRMFLRGQAIPIDLRGWIGLNAGELKVLLDSRMQPEMNWNNYGKLWQVDHVVPFWLFNLEDEKDLKLVWHPDNLMPLAGRDNIHKEGSLEFALDVLQKIPWSPRVEMLIERVEKEIKVLDKYKKAHVGGKFYDPFK